MASNKEELRALLKFVVALCKKEGNEWFKEELLQALGAEHDRGACAFVGLGENLTSRVSDIERYLSLDYKIDSAPSIINYDHIRSEGFRTKLRQDNQEMLRYRYGTRGHVIDFLEFCKFAHLQAEALLNYYYGHKGTNIEEILTYIEKHLPAGFNIFGRDKKAQVLDISYIHKKMAFCNEFNSKTQDYPLTFQFNNTLEFIRQARNSLSHRSGERDKSWSEYFNKVINRSGLPVKDFDFDMYKINQNSFQLQRFNSEFQNNSKYNDYRYNLWMSRKPFDEVIFALSKMAEIIQSQIP